MRGAALRLLSGSCLATPSETFASGSFRAGISSPSLTAVDPIGAGRSAMTAFDSIRSDTTGSCRAFPLDTKCISHRTSIA
jgi:hypothetical protein